MELFGWTIPRIIEKNPPVRNDRPNNKKCSPDRQKEELPDKEGLIFKKVKINIAERDDGIWVNFKGEISKNQQAINITFKYKNGNEDIKYIGTECIKTKIDRISEFKSVLGSLIESKEKQNEFIEQLNYEEQILGELANELNPRKEKDQEKIEKIKDFMKEYGDEIFELVLEELNKSRVDQEIA